MIALLYSQVTVFRRDKMRDSKRNPKQRVMYGFLLSQPSPLVGKVDFAKQKTDEGIHNNNFYS